MISRPPALALLAALALIIAALTACGGDDDGAGESTATPTATEETQESPTTDGADDETPSSDLEVYFAALEEIAVETDDGLTDVSDALNVPIESDEQYVLAVQTAFLQAGQIVESAVLNMSELEPPPAAEAAHEEFIATLTQLLSANSAFYSDAEEATTGEEIDALLTEHDQALTEARDAFDTACSALQDIAIENGIAADIRCG